MAGDFGTREWKGRFCCVRQLTLRDQTGAIDDLHKAVSKETDPAKLEEGKKITNELATLKYELQHNRQLT